MKYLYPELKATEWDKIHFKTKQKIYREILYSRGFLDDTVVSLLARIIFYQNEDEKITPIKLQKNLSEIIADIEYGCYGELSIKNLRTHLTRLRKSEHRQVLIRSYKNTKSRGDKGINIILSQSDYEKLEFIIAKRLITKKTFIRDCISKEYQNLKNMDGVCNILGEN